MQIAAVLFPRLTALDLIGPYETLQRLPDATVTFVGHERGEVRTENGFLGLTADATFDEVQRPDVVIVPGGIGTRALLDDAVLLDWLRTVHQTTLFTTSVCTGSLVLAAAGLLTGLEATTHWSVLHLLESLGAKPTTQRVVEHLDRRIITAAGVSAGIDMALRLAELLVALRLRASRSGIRNRGRTARRLLQDQGVAEPDSVPSAYFRSWRAIDQRCTSLGPS